VDSYKIAVEILLAGGLAQALTGVAAQMTGLHGQVGQINAAFKGWGSTLAIVAGAAGVGLVVKGIEDIFESTKKLSHELAQIEKMGVNPAQLAGVRAGALGVTRNVPGVTETEALAMYGQTYSIMGHDEALKAMGQLSQFPQILGNTTGDYEAANKSVYQMIRSADLIGQLSDPTTKQLDPERLQKFLDIATKVALATHGQIGPQQWLGLARQGGPSLRGLTDEGLISQAIVAQAMGAQRAGTASMSLMQQFAGGTMFTRNAAALQEHGLLQEGEWSKSGGRVVLTDAASKRLMDLIKRDPLEFVQNLMKDYAAKGITSPDDQIRAVFRDFGRQTTQREVADIMLNIQQMLSERQRIVSALSGGGAFNVQNLHDITQAVHDVSAAFENLRLAIGGPQSDRIAAGINAIASAASGITEVTRAIAASGLGDIVALFAKALPGIGPLTTLINALGWVGTQSAALQSAAASIHSFFDAIESLIRRVGSLLPGWATTHGPTGPVPDTGLGGLPNPDLRRDTSPGLQDYFGGKKMNFVPPSRSQPIIHTTAELKLDGLTLARAVEDRIAQDHEFPDSADAANGVAYPHFNAWNPIDK
jgi:hypothetical protein